MTKLELNESYISTIIRCLNFENTYASRGTLLELQRQGIFLPVYALRTLIEKGDIKE